MKRNRAGERLIQEGAPRVTGADVAAVVERSEQIQRKFRGRGPLQRFVDDGRLLIASVKDYWEGRYRRMPWGTVAAMAFSLLYVFNPFDLVPDVLPIIGEVDDAAVLAACLFLVEHDLLAYRQWKEAGPPPLLEAPDDREP